MREPEIKCRWCKGTGHRPLPKPILRVLKVIMRLGQPSCPEIYQEINVDYQDQSIANQYVKRLLKEKLIRKVQVNGSRVPRYESVKDC